MTLMMIGCLTLALFGLWLHTKETWDSPPAGGAGCPGAHLPISGLLALPWLPNCRSTLEGEDANTRGAASALSQELGNKVGNFTSLHRRLL